MATKQAQRIGIWIIVIIFAISSIAVFFVLILSTQNSQVDEKRITELTNQYYAEIEEQTKELSDDYFSVIAPYKDRVAKFDADSVSKLSSKDLKQGTGEEITADSSYSAYYIGWGPDGEIFDTKLNEDSLKEPFAVSPGGVIEGWAEGVVGMKLGGVRELTIPSDLAYGEAGSSTGSIAPNTPLKFVVLAIQTPEEIEVPQEVIDYYATQQ
jgi:FKBP-type peptidyl-prolyl cis-trans isomerase FkpA